MVKIHFENNFGNTFLCKMIDSINIFSAIYSRQYVIHNYVAFIYVESFFLELFQCFFFISLYLKSIPLSYIYTYTYISRKTPNRSRIDANL